MMWIAAAVIVVAIVAGLAHRKRAEVVERESLKPTEQMSFPVVPSEGDRYASANGSWVFTVSGWELE